MQQKQRSEILAIVADFLSMEPTTLNEDSTLEEVCLESLKLVELIFNLEERYGVSIPLEGLATENDSADLRVSALIDRICHALDQRDRHPKMTA